jgi:hypothetical protein
LGTSGRGQAFGDSWRRGGRGEFYPKDYPASTLIVAAGFALPEIMVEITATAVVPK